MSMLIVTVGLPYSGKSLWANCQLGVTIVNRDSVRLALHGERYLQAAEEWIALLTRTMVRSLALSGNHTIIIDECNVTEKRRAQWAVKDIAWETKFLVFPTSREECIERALSVDDQRIIPIIDRMAAEWEWPDKYTTVGEYGI